MAFTSDNSPRLKSAALLRGFGVLSLLVACLFLAVGGVRAYQDHMRATQWPAVEAQVNECLIHKYYTVRSHVSGEQDQVRCSFQYEIGGVSYQQEKDAGSSVFYSPKQMILVQPKITREKLHLWISRHPKGSAQTIHYNPADPREISLAGADDEIQQNASRVQLKIAATLFSVSAVFLFIGFAARQRARSFAAPDPNQAPSN